MLEETEILENLGITYKLYFFCKELASLDEISKAMNINTGQIVRTFIFKDQEGELFALLTSGNKTARSEEIQLKIGHNLFWPALYKDIILCFGYYSENFTPLSLLDKKIPTKFDEDLLYYWVVVIVSEDNKYCYEISSYDLYRIIVDVIF